MKLAISPDLALPLQAVTETSGDLIADHLIDARGDEVTDGRAA